jgi:hypothetical protein
MEDPPRAETTALLLKWGTGAKDALDRVMPLVCGELRRVARIRLKGDAQHHLTMSALTLSACTR